MASGTLRAVVRPGPAADGQAALLAATHTVQPLLTNGVPQSAPFDLTDQGEERAFPCEIAISEGLQASACSAAQALRLGLRRLLIVYSHEVLCTCHQGERWQTGSCSALSCDVDKGGHALLCARALESGVEQAARKSETCECQCFVCTSNGRGDFITGNADCVCADCGTPFAALSGRLFASHVSVRRLVSLPHSVERFAALSAQRELLSGELECDVCAVKTSVADARPLKQVGLGNFRPDFLLVPASSFGSLDIDSNAQTLPVELRVCEINCRFAVNCYHYTQVVCEASGQGMLRLETESDDCVVRQQSALLDLMCDTEHLLYGTRVITEDMVRRTRIVIDKELPGWDIRLLLQRLKFYDPSATYDTLLMKPTNLECNSFGQLVHSTSDEIIDFVVLELHQSEIEQLPSCVIESLALHVRCLNPLASVLVGHDKRLLALLSNASIMAGVLSARQAELLSRFVVPTFALSVPGAASALANARESNTQTSWVFKVATYGKGQGMIFGPGSCFEGVERDSPDWKRGVVSFANGEPVLLQTFMQTAQIRMPGNFGEQKTDHGIVGTLTLSDVAPLRCAWGMFRVARTSCINLACGGWMLNVCEEVDLKTPRCWSQEEIGSLAVSSRLFPDLARLSLLSKIDLVSAVALRHSSLRRLAGYVSRSGGSGGDPLYFITDAAENKFMRERYVTGLIHEFELFVEGDIYLNLNAGSDCYRSMEIDTHFCELVGATSLPLGGSCSDESAFATMQKLGANCVGGSPTRLVQFAEFVIAHRENVLTCDSSQAITKIIYGGEPLFGIKRDRLKEAFGANLKMFGILGSAETGIWALHPPSLSTAENVGFVAYYYDPSLVHIEIVAPDEHGFGTIVVTNLVRARLVPVYRFDTGDIGRLSTSRSGTKFPLLHLRGRDITRTIIVGNQRCAVASLEKVVQQFCDELSQTHVVVSLSADARDLLDIYVSRTPRQPIEACVALIQQLVASDGLGCDLIQVNIHVVADTRAMPATYMDSSSGKARFLFDTRAR